MMMNIDPVYTLVLADLIVIYAHARALWSNLL